MPDTNQRNWQVCVPLLRRDRAGFLERLRAADDDLTGILGFLRSQRLIAAVAARVREMELEPELPAELVAALRDARRIHHVIAVENVEATTDLHTRLHAADVPHLVLKGPLMSLRVHGDLAFRKVGDIDLLVPLRCVDRLEEDLLADGWSASYELLGGRRLAKWMTHHFSYGRGDQALELHWQIVREAGIRVDQERVWARAEEMDFRGTRLPVPDLETTLLIQVLGLVKDLELGAPVLSSLVDLRETALALGPGFDWSGPLALLEAQGVGRAAAAVLELTLRLTESAVDLPGLATVVAAKRHGLDPSHPTLGLEVFDLRPPAWRNKRLLFPLHRGGWAASWTWWALSYPVRRAVYQGS